MQTQAFWVRRRYSLSPLDPRFLALTPLDVATEYWAHQYAERPAGVQEVESEDYDAVMQAMNRGEDWESVIDG